LISLREANEKFCKGADHFLYELMINGKHVITKNPPRFFDPTRQSVLRTLKFKSPGQWYLAIDIDGEGLTDDILNACKRVWWGCKAGEKPLIKDSGRKGAQLVWKVIFPKPLTEDKVHDKLQVLAWNVYREHDMEDFGIGFGRPGIPKPHVDTSMYETNRKIRGFCSRFDGSYSVPLAPEDNLSTALRKRRLKLELEDYEIGTIIYSDERIVYDDVPYLMYDEELGLIDEVSLDPSKVKATGRQIYDRLPNYLKACVMYPGDLHHYRKRYLVWYMLRMLYTPEEIIEFVIDNCQWSDLNSRTETTKQVVSLTNTYKKVVAESGAMTFPRYVLG